MLFKYFFIAFIIGCCVEVVASSIPLPGSNIKAIHNADEITLGSVLNITQRVDTVAAVDSNGIEIEKQEVISTIELAIENTTPNSGFDVGEIISVDMLGGNIDGMQTEYYLQKPTIGETILVAVDSAADKSKGDGTRYLLKNPKVIPAGENSLQVLEWAKNIRSSSGQELRKLINQERVNDGFDYDENQKQYEDLSDQVHTPYQEYDISESTVTNVDFDLHDYSDLEEEGYLSSKKERDIQMTLTDATVNKVALSAKGEDHHISTTKGEKVLSSKPENRSEADTKNNGYGFIIIVLALMMIVVLVVFKRKQHKYLR